METSSFSSIIANISIGSNASTVDDELLDTSVIRAIGIIIGIFDIIVGSFGNLLTIIAVLFNKKLHTTFHIFIANLCVVDFLTASTMMPFNVTAYLTETWPFGEDSISCSFMAFSYYCCGYSSIVCLVIITVNRFIGVVYPRNYETIFSKKRVRLTVLISWLFAPAFMAPFFFFSSDGQSSGYGWINKYTLCVFRVDRWNKYHMFYMQFIRILFQFLPVVIMIVLYIIIFQTSKKAGLAVQKYASTSNCTNDFHKKDESSLLKSLYNLNRASKWNSERGFSEHQKLTSLSVPNSSLSSSDSKLYSMKMSTYDKKIRKVPEKLASQRETSFSLPTTPVIGKIRWMDKAPYSNSSTESIPFGSMSINSLEPSAQNCTDCNTQQRGGMRRKYTASKLAAKKRKLMDQRLLRISVVICAVFMILFLPSVIINLIPRDLVPDNRLHMAASIITWLNSCVNPLIYCFMSANMRQHYRLLFRALCNSLQHCVLFEKNKTSKNLRKTTVELGAVKSCSNEIFLLNTENSNSLHFPAPPRVKREDE